MINKGLGKSRIPWTQSNRYERSRGSLWHCWKYYTTEFNQAPS